jgi:transcription initiation factor TFIID subunit 12
MEDKNHVISKSELQRLANDVQLDDQVVEFLQEHAETFVDSVTEFACMLAKHRNSNTLESCDIQLALEQLWGLRVPFIGQSVPTLKKPSVVPAHIYRMQVIDSEKYSKETRKTSSSGRTPGKTKRTDKASKSNRKDEWKVASNKEESTQKAVE